MGESPDRPTDPAALPLSKVRVLEIGGYIAAPYATAILSGLGADVIKVEKPVTGDDFRRGENDGSLYFIQYNAGKRSLAVDLKQPAGVELVKALIPTADVLVENLRPGRLESLGLSADACRAINPGLVYASVSGFGNGGPLERRPAYDTIGQAVGGLYSLLSDAGTEQLGGTPLADLIAGISTVTGVLAALVGRADLGVGSRVDTSVMEAVSLLTIDAFTQYFDDDGVDPSRQSRHPQAQNFCLETASGEYLAIHLSSSEKFWRSFLGALERPELGEDPRFRTYKDRVAHYDELVPIVEEVFRGRAAAEWNAVLIEHDIPFGPVHTMSSYLRDPQTEWLEIVEPERHGLRVVRPPWRFDGVRPTRAGKPPRVGEHTREIAAEVLDATQIDDLMESGVLFADPAASEARTGVVTASHH